MKKNLLSLLVVIVAISSLFLLQTVKGAKTMNDASNPSVLIKTNMGNITIELDAKNAPISTANFLAYVEDGYFADTIFHRIIPGFMIQGGGLTAGMADKASDRAAIENEADNGLANDRATLAMARTGDPHSATSQFFINLKDNGFLNHSGKTMQGWGYAVFAKVTKGMDIVDAMAKVQTGNKGSHADVPLETIIIMGAMQL